MRLNIKSAVTVGAAVLMAIFLLAGCGSLSKDIKRDGTSAEQLVWPDHDDTTPMHDKGTWPSLSDVERIEPGMTKEQIADVIGTPHFGEGVWFVREWDYLFNFRIDEEHVVCQHKILFDEDALARSFYWKPESCADLLKARSETFTFSGDALFRFDSVQLVAEGYGKLEKMASELMDRQNRIDSIEVAGYTDRLGSATYNRTLSQNRADAVMHYLRTEGIPADLVVADGHGEADPVKTNCSHDASHAEQAACLQPNRRVEITVQMKR